jgi:hypothetical protein
LNTFYNNLGGGWYWGGFGEATTTEENTPVGTLVVDIFDTPTKHLIWRSVATNTLSGDPEKNAKKLQKTVDEISRLHLDPGVCFILAKIGGMVVVGLYIRKQQGADPEHTYHEDWHELFLHLSLLRRFLTVPIPGSG